ncbi:DUF1501 domain-containing protein [Tundrisphaera lichenicola]|uniref:DUF1501 domain-containing protein n=1 Tax=Tundrisphaera lichenicola TaxID=2029860 RepID=UPI003EBA626B
MPHPTSRRDILKGAACGFGYLALAGLAAGRASADSGNPLASRAPHLIPKAKRVIFLFMQGGVSQVDSFDYKPRLDRDHGKSMPFDDARVIANTGARGSSQRVMKSLWKFDQHGESGRWGSELFPEMNRNLDDLCFIHSMHTEGVAHGPATLFLHCGATTNIRPSMGSWVLYGLGSENENLPGFVTIGPSAGNGGARNYGNAFLPALYQGTALGKAGGPASEATIRNLRNPLLSDSERRRGFDLLRDLNAEQVKAHPGDSELEATIESYELAWRMQQNAPDVLDIANESQATRDLYGIGNKETDNFGRQCLMARRMCEAGVRFVQVTYGDNTANPAWDQHSDMPKHANHARAVDKPIAGLLADLKSRGLLEDTLVWWGSEFGRTSYAQANGTGRDHNPDGFTTWLAGAGVKPGFAFGETDEFGHRAAVDKVHMHDLHATILHLLGLDHERLTYTYSGRPFRLTDVSGRVVREILA